MKVEHGMLLCFLLIAFLALLSNTIFYRKPPVTTPRIRRLARSGLGDLELPKLKGTSSMPVNVERYSDDEVVEKRIATVNSWIGPAMKRRIFFMGYEAFFDDKLLKDCGYSCRSPSYELYREGWAQAFRDYTNATKRYIKRNGQDGASCGC